MGNILFHTPFAVTIFTIGMSECAYCSNWNKKKNSFHKLQQKYHFYSSLLFFPRVTKESFYILALLRQHYLFNLTTITTTTNPAWPVSAQSNMNFYCLIWCEVCVRVFFKRHFGSWYIIFLIQFVFQHSCTLPSHQTGKIILVWPLFECSLWCTLKFCLRQFVGLPYLYHPDDLRKKTLSAKAENGLLLE